MWTHCQTRTRSLSSEQNYVLSCRSTTEPSRHPSRTLRPWRSAPGSPLARRWRSERPEVQWVLPVAPSLEPAFLRAHLGDAPVVLKIGSQSSVQATVLPFR